MTRDQSILIEIINSKSSSNKLEFYSNIHCHSLKTVKGGPVLTLRVCNWLVGRRVGVKLARTQTFFVKSKYFDTFAGGEQA